MDVVTNTDIDILEKLNFTYAPPCEVAWHEAFGHTLPAEFIVDSSCPRCGDSVRILVCQECLDVALFARMWCEVCNHAGPASEFWKIAGTI